MTGKRKVYTAEFKLQAVQMTLQPERTVGSVAQELGVSISSMTRWIGEYRGKGEKAFPGHGKVVLTVEQAEIQRLKRELEITRQERDILKRAMAFFAKESK
jgi:transposase